MKIKQLLILLFAIVSFAGISNDKPNIKKLLYDAEDSFYEQNYRKAIDLYFKLDSIDPTDHAYYTFQIGLSYLYSNIDNSMALYYLEESFPEMSQTEIADMVYFSMGQAYHTNYMFDQAIENYTKVLELIEGADALGLEKEVNHQIEICKNAKIIVSEGGSTAEIVSVGNAINSEYPDYKAVVTADESVMFFTARKPGSTGGKVDYTGRYYEDIYITERDPFGYWDYPTQVSRKINTEWDEATIGLSVDGTKMYIYKGDVKGGEIYVANLNGMEWSQPQPVEDQVNTKFWETSATISADGRTIYFSSTRKGGRGERDLYKCTLGADSTWGNVENLGNVINTVYDEDTPFIHPDGKTLYFSSRGHNTMGGFDVFKSVYENGQWSEPVNMGYPINSTCDDFHFVANARGTKGYFSSSRNDGMGEQDIYMVKISDTGVPLLLVRGNVITDRPEEPISAKMTITDIANHEGLRTIYQPNSETGKYIIILPPSKQYEMLVQADGYPDYKTVITMPDVNEYHEFYQEIYLKNGEITVNNLFYDLRDSSKVSDTTLIAAANANNRDYLESLTHNIADKVNETGANSINELDPYKLVDQIFSVTDPVSEKLAEKAKEEELLANAGEEEGNETTQSEEIDSTATKEETSSQGEDDYTAELTFTVKFPFDKFVLEDKYMNDIEVIFSTYKRHQNATLEIDGHTDSKGSENYNLALSKKRAETVARLLKEKGVPADKIKIAGYGESRPMAPNVNPDGSDNPQGRAENRRTEVKIINH